MFKIDIVVSYSCVWKLYTYFVTYKLLAAIATTATIVEYCFIFSGLNTKH